MSDAMTGEVGFLAAIEAGDDSADLLRIYADWCEERERRDEAYALRWMAARDRRPGLRKRVNVAARWFWFRPGAVERLRRGRYYEWANDVLRNPRAELPEWVFQVARADRRDTNAGVPSWDAAVGELADGLRQLRLAAAIDPARLAP